MGTTRPPVYGTYSSNHPNKQGCLETISPFVIFFRKPPICLFRQARIFSQHAYYYLWINSRELPLWVVFSQGTLI